MTILEAVRQMIADCPLIGLSAESINIDISDAEPTNYAVTLASETIEQEYIDGTQMRAVEVLFFAVENGDDNWQRLMNVNTLSEIRDYFEELTIYPDISAGRILDLSSSNVPISISGNSDNSALKYIISIKMKYERPAKSVVPPTPPTPQPPDGTLWLLDAKGRTMIDADNKKIVVGV